MISESAFAKQKITASSHLGNVMRKVPLFLSVIGILVFFGLGLIKDFPGLIRKYFTEPGVTINLSSTANLETIDNVWVMIGQVNQSRILSDLRKLSGVDPICINENCYTIMNRMTGSDGLSLAENYVLAQLTDLGFTVQTQQWSSGGFSDINIITRKPGSSMPGEEIYFVSHLDGENCPAADDNGSGAVSLLELARIISHRNFNRTIVLLFTTGEEQGTLGVKSYINQLTPDQLSAIKYVINVDMIGYDANNDGKMELFNGTQPPDFVEQLLEIISDYRLNLQPEIYSDCG